jgi:hypothetical protein
LLKFEATNEISVIKSADVLVLCYSASKPQETFERYQQKSNNEIQGEVLLDSEDTRGTERKGKI